MFDQAPCGGAQDLVVMVGLQPVDRRLAGRADVWSREPFASVFHAVAIGGDLADAWRRQAALELADRIEEIPAVAWNRLVDQPWRIMSIGRRKWVRAS